jgi:PhoH-like ATPase
MLSNCSDLEILKNSDQRQAFILDTNVLLHDPSSIFRFDEHLVIIPLTAIEEIDAKKNDPGIGYNAREISIKLEMLSSRHSQEPFIPLSNGKDGILIFLAGEPSVSIPAEFNVRYKDNLMLAQVIELKKNFPARKFTFITKDRNLRIKCHIFGIDTEDYKHDKISEEYLASLFKPLQQLILIPEEINELFSDKVGKNWYLGYRKKWHLRENEGVILYDTNDSFIGLAIRKEDRLTYLDYQAIKVLGTAPKVLDTKNYSYNFEQAICMHQALEDQIKVQVIIGKAGTGKTHIAMAAALEKVFKEKKFESIKLIKPIITKSRLGEDIGFLPGSIRRKLLPKMRPFVEKLRLFTSDDEKIDDSGYQKLLDSGIIELINLADVRGADLSNAILIFDEAQNANPFQMRTLGTRLGDNTKLIVLGDPTQIDSVYLDKYSNALINLYLNALKNPASFLSQICLIQMVRSHTSKWFETVIQTETQTPK